MNSPKRQIAVGTLGTGKTTFLLTKALLTHSKVFVFDAKNDISISSFPESNKIAKKHSRIAVVESVMTFDDFVKYYDKFSVFVFRFEVHDLTDYAVIMRYIWSIAKERLDDVAVFLDEAEVFNKKGFLVEMSWLSTKSRSRNISVYATATRLPYIDRALRDNTTDYYVFYTTSDRTISEIEEITSDKKIREKILKLKKFSYIHIDLNIQETFNGQNKKVDVSSSQQNI